MYRGFAAAATAIILCIILVYVSVYTSQRTHGAVVVRFAVELNDHSGPFWVAYDLGWFDEEGIVVEYKTFATGLDLAVEMARGDIDVALVCIGPAILMKARGADVKLVAMTHLYGYALVANPKYNNVRDLDGRVVAAPGPGSPCWLLMKIVEGLCGVKFKYVKMPPYMAVSALLAGKVDAAFIPEHYVTLAEARGARVILRGNDVWRGMPGSGVVVTGKFLREHGDVVTKIIRIIDRAVEYIKENFSSAAEIMAKRLATSYDIVYESMRSLEYTSKIDLDQLRRYVNLLYKYGAIDRPINVDEFVWRP